MPETVAQPIAAPAPSKGLLPRAVGVIFAPKATYAAIVARPRVFGALLLILFISCAGTIALLSTGGTAGRARTAASARRAFGAPDDRSRRPRWNASCPTSAIGAAYIVVVLVARFAFRLYSRSSLPAARQLQAGLAASCIQARVLSPASRCRSTTSESLTARPTGSSCRSSKNQFYRPFSVPRPRRHVVDSEAALSARRLSRRRTGPAAIGIVRHLSRNRPRHRCP